ncbi:MAG: leucine-rich repeat protein [Mogibacterium sp.]|nr:leucine-rich repeat protein [Mogibacterium sp.]
MDRKRILSILLAIMMVFPVQIFALDDTSASIETDSQSVELTEQSAGDIQSGDDETIDTETLPEEASGSVEGDGEAVAEEDTAQELDYSTWTTADFTYAEYSQRLYGCDYSRDFTISGMAIAGFSETGLLKLEQNKDLVLPSTTDTGEEVVGVAKDAFYAKGLTSVQFPTGMYVNYDDELTHLITQRGNFVIAENAFANNELTSVKLPDGVIALMSNAFYNNKLTTVTLPKTIWWMETQCFAKNQITKVGFPERTWFMMEMHGMAFANNKIQSVRLPDTTAVVNKHTFMLNPGMEPLPAEAAEDMTAAAFEGSGVVYMYTDNEGLWDLDRIHHIDKTTASTKSWFQKLIINNGNPDTQNPDSESWNRGDFTIDGTTITGLSASGLEKRKTNTDLILPDYNEDGKLITAIADAPAQSGGLFATAEEKITSVTLPSGLKKIGMNAFREAGLTEVDFPPKLEEIGQSAFMMNSLETVVLPDTVKTMGAGAFSTNKTLKKVVLSRSLTEIPAAAFACSDSKNWMADLTSVTIPEGVTKIGARAFAGSNIISINIPEGVTEIGEYAFSTKNYLMLDDAVCSLKLPGSLTKIGNRAFRNKLIAEVELPESVEALPELTFEKMLSTHGTPDIPGSEPYDMVTKVYVSSREQYDDRENFPESEFHKLILTDFKVWTPEDFTYGEWTVADQSLFLGNNTDDCLTPTLWVVTGFSDTGKAKFKQNQHLVIPAEDPDGRKVQGVGASAFKGSTLESELGYKVKSVTFPENVKTQNDKTSWDPDLEERGDFFIGNSAFIRNELTALTLPEGVIFVDTSAFAYNQLRSVSFPSTITLIKSQAFGSNQISTLDFTDTVDFSLNVENMAFAINKVVSVQLPDNVGVMGALRPATTLSTVFFQNTGVEPVTGGTSALQKGGIVYMYKKTDSDTDLIYNTENGGSYVQKLVIGEIPSDEAPWGVSDFTFDEEGTTITGLSDAGKSKIRINQDLVLPDNGPEGQAVKAIGDGVMGSAGEDQIGTFGIAVDGTPYVPVSVRLPERLESIGNNAFSAYIDSSTGETIGLTEIEFPESLKTIGNTAFQNAPLTSVILPDSVTTLGNGAFSGTIYVNRVILSKSLTAIPAGAFVKTNNKIPFDQMATIESLEIPESIKSIGNTAFQGSKIRELTLHEGLETIGNSAFSNSQISDLYLPGSVLSVGSSSFAVINETLQNTLTRLEFGKGFDGTIAANAFRGHALAKAEIPSEYSFDKIKAGAFTDTEAKVRLLTSNEEEAARYAALDNNSAYSFEVVYDKLAGSGWEEEDFTFSEDGTALTGWSESGRAKFETMKNLILPDCAPDGTPITMIGDRAFAVAEEDADIGKYEANSDGLRSVVLPEGLEKIGERAFEYNMLTAIDFRSLKSLSEIGKSAFHGNHLGSVYLPDTVNVLGEGAFAMNSITELRLSENVTVIPQGAFSMNIRMSHVEIPSTVTEICEMAFAGARLTELTIPASVTKIGRKAFHLHHLETLTVPGNVKEIGESAFEGTYKEQTLLDLNLEEGIESIGKYAFKEGLLTTVALPSSLKTMGVEPFENNTGTGEGHVVILTSTNPDHLAFNEGAKYHLVVVEDSSARDKAAQELEESIINANSIAASGEYTSESYKDLMDAIDAANALIDDPASTTDQLSEAKSNVVRALRNLKPVDKTAQEAEKDRDSALNTLVRNIIDANNEVVASVYKALSYESFKAALDKANAAVDDTSADAEALREANKELLLAWKNLVRKDPQRMTVKAASKKVKAKKVKKAKQTVKALTVANAVGKVTYKKAGGSKKLSVNAKTGKITVKKGTKKGSYKIKVKVTASGDSNYKAATKTVTVKIRVK